MARARGGSAVTWFGGKKAAARNKAARSGARRRAREAAAAGPVAPLTLPDLWERDRGTCALCRLPVPHPSDIGVRPRQRASVEHRIPLSKHGKDEPSNQQLAHAGCNSEKGARTAPRKKGLRRRLWRRTPKPKPPIPDDVF